LTLLSFSFRNFGLWIAAYRTTKGHIGFVAFRAPLQWGLLIIRQVSSDVDFSTAVVAQSQPHMASTMTVRFEPQKSIFSMPALSILPSNCIDEQVGVLKVRETGMYCVSSGALRRQPA
jgi:hypothetical protein